MLEKHVIFRYSCINYMFSVNYIFLLNITYVFAIITCMGFLMSISSLHMINVNHNHFYKSIQYTPTWQLKYNIAI